MSTGRSAWVALFAAVVGLAGFAPAADDGKAPAAPAAGPVETDAGFEVVRHTDIPYRTDPAADKERHRLDVYVPKGCKDFPVVFFVHGGSWRSGNKSYYVAIGNTFAKLGIGVVVTNYRLSPQVKHPAHIEDVAKAFAWTCANIGKFGGRPDRIFACGHSAGGHLVSLLATDPTYLKAENRSPADIAGVIAVSGVYRIYHDFGLFNRVFGKDEEVCRQASPINHVGGKLPPFLIAYADTDYPQLDTMAEDMYAALKKAACPAALLKLKDRNHFTIILKMIDPADPLHRALLKFVGK
jgi:acetyl esterase/lipase